MKYFLVLFFSVFQLSALAQYTEENSFIRKALVVYHKDSVGFYHSSKDVLVNRVDDVKSVYAYDKKAHNLYVQTAWGNYVVTLSNDYAKVVKKNKLIPQPREEILMQMVDSVSNVLKQRAILLNKTLKHQIKEKRMKAYRDSVDSVRHEEQLRLQIEQKRMRAQQEKLETEKAYRETHSFDSLEIGSVRFDCVLCPEVSYINNETIKCLGIKNDTLFYSIRRTGDYGLPYNYTHAAILSETVINDSILNMHLKAFGDTLSTCGQQFSAEKVEKMNEKAFAIYRREVKKHTPPYGYVEEWSWDMEYHNISFSIEYRNTNPSTIKYLQVHFAVTNDVGDIRKTGYFSCTGPVKEGQSGSWSCDDSSYYVFAGDATKMKITKLIITYMNGRKVVIPEKKIVYSSQDDD